MHNLLGQGFTLSQITRRVGGRRTGKFSLPARDLDDIYREGQAVESRFSFITFQQPLAGLWDVAERLCANTNIAPADAIHLATALGAQCNILVSRDSDFLSIAKPYILAEAPERFDKALKEWEGDGQQREPPLKRR